MPNSKFARAIQAGAQGFFQMSGFMNQQKQSAMQQELHQAQMSQIETPEEQEARYRDRFEYQRGLAKSDIEEANKFTDAQPIPEGYTRIKNRDGSYKLVPRTDAEWMAKQAEIEFDIRSGLQDKEIQKRKKLLGDFYGYDANGNPIPPEGAYLDPTTMTIGWFRGGSGGRGGSGSGGGDGMEQVMTGNEAAKATENLENYLKPYNERLGKDEKPIVLGSLPTPVLQTALLLANSGQIGTALDIVIGEHLATNVKVDPRFAAADTGPFTGPVTDEHPADLNPADVPSRLIEGGARSRQVSSEVEAELKNVLAEYKRQGVIPPDFRYFEHTDFAASGGGISGEDMESERIARQAEIDSNEWRRLDDGGFNRTRTTPAGNRAGEMVTFDGKRGRIIAIDYPNLPEGTTGIEAASGRGTRYPYTLTVSFPDGTVVQVPETEVSKEMPYDQSYNIINEAPPIIPLGAGRR